MRICVDTNVLYNVLFRTEKTEKAIKLLDRHTQDDLFITTTILNELLYTATVKLLNRPGPRKLRKIIATRGYPAPIREALQLVQDLELDLLTETVTPEELLETMTLYRLLPSDAIIALTCRRHGITNIISFDEDFDRAPMAHQDPLAPTYKPSYPEIQIGEQRWSRQRRSQ